MIFMLYDKTISSTWNVLPTHGVSDQYTACFLLFFLNPVKLSISLGYFPDTLNCGIHFLSKLSVK